MDSNVGMLVCWPVMLMFIAWIAMKFGTDTKEDESLKNGDPLIYKYLNNYMMHWHYFCTVIHGFHTMNLNDFGEWLFLQFFHEADFSGLGEKS